MSFTLRSGLRIPALGYGCWKVPKASAAESVYTAIKLGYRHLDCACDYGNEEEVGAGIARALAEQLVTREELWVTSKLWCTFHDPAHVKAACQRSLADLGLAYLDLYLMHFPIPLAYVDPSVRYPPEWLHDPASPSPCMVPARVPLAATWGAMLALQDEGLVRACGVCNFGCALLRDLCNSSPRAPEVLQVELHPHLQQPKLLRYCAGEGIHVTGFSPLGAGSYVELGGATPADSALLHPAIAAIAQRTGATPAQVVLAWAVQSGRSAVPKSSSPQRMAENLAAASLPPLSPEDRAAIALLDQGRRFNDPGVL
jgi:D-xylose reductase